MEIGGPTGALSHPPRKNRDRRRLEGARLVPKEAAVQWGARPGLTGAGMGRGVSTDILGSNKNPP